MWIILIVLFATIAAVIIKYIEKRDKEQEQIERWQSTRNKTVQEIKDMADAMKHEDRFQQLLKDIDCVIDEHTLIYISVSNPYKVKVVWSGPQTETKWAKEQDHEVSFEFNKYDLMLRTSSLDIPAFLYLILQTYPFLTYVTYVKDSGKLQRIFTRNLYPTYFSEDPDSSLGEHATILWNSNSAKLLSIFG